MESAHYIPYTGQTLNYPVITSYKTGYEKLLHNGSSNKVSPRWQKYGVVTDLLAASSHSTCFITWHRCKKSIMMTSSNGNISALLAICAGNSAMTGEFPTQRPVTRSFDVFFDLHLKTVWVNNREAVDSRSHRAHYDVTVIFSLLSLRVLSYQ